MPDNTVSAAPRPIDVADPSGVNASFREALSHFCSGVVVVTAIDTAARPVGMTVGSFTSISLEPALVGFCAGATSTTLPHIASAGHFCVNVLAEDQSELARNFAVRGAAKFAGTIWAPGRNAAPRLSGAHAWIECAVASQQSIGDHELVVGAVSALSVPRGNEPLVFHRSVFHGLQVCR